MGHAPRSRQHTVGGAAVRRKPGQDGPANVGPAITDYDRYFSARRCVSRTPSGVRSVPSWCWQRQGKRPGITDGEPLKKRRALRTVVFGCVTKCGDISGPGE